MSLRDKQVGLTMRLDIDTPPRELRETVVKRLRADGASKAVIVLFDPDESNGSFDRGESVEPAGSALRPGHRTARPLIRAVRRAGLKVVDAIVRAPGSFLVVSVRRTSLLPPGGPALADGGAARSQPGGIDLRRHGRRAPGQP